MFDGSSGIECAAIVRASSDLARCRTPAGLGSSTFAYGDVRVMRWRRVDDCRVRVGDAAQNFAILRRIALNLLKNEKTTKLSVASKRLKAGWNADYLGKVLGLTI